MPRVVVIDDACDGCGDQGLGVIWKVGPVICADCLARALCLMMDRPDDLVAAMVRASAARAGRAG